MYIFVKGHKFYCTADSLKIQMYTCFKTTNFWTLWMYDSRKTLRFTAVLQFF